MSFSPITRRRSPNSIASPANDPLANTQLTRRTVMKALTWSGGAALGHGLPLTEVVGHTNQSVPTLRGASHELRVGESLVNLSGSPRFAVTVNGAVPSPTLRWREGDTVVVRVQNALTEDTSIHWHGILVPANMDGVPGLSFNGIAPGESHVYRFTVRQGGTYWYHSHSGFQEQRGMYGALIIDPLEPEPFRYERDHVLMLSDWSDEHPDQIFAKLKKRGDYYNFRQPTVWDFLHEWRTHGFRRAAGTRLDWGAMRMNRTDLSDVSGATYTYLLNGQAPQWNWTGLFTPGERVRLRVINGSAMTYFDVRIPGLRMTVVAADGQYVHPVTVDEFRIGVAETFDVIIEPTGRDAFTIFAQSMDRTGYARGTLAVRRGLSAPVPSMDPRPVLTMGDMGHGVAPGPGMAPPIPMAERNGEAGRNTPMPGHPAPHGPAQGMSENHSPRDARRAHNRHGLSGLVTHAATERENPLVDMQTMIPSSRLDDPGIGLRNNGRRALTYSDLRSLFNDPDGRVPHRTVEMHLTGHMERFAWSFDGIKFANAEPVRLTYGERMRIVLVNDTMMAHPVHLHGMWSDVEDDTGEFHLRKHIVDMPPGSKRSFRVRADALGRWAFHCHLLYHMAAGMFREVRVDE
jgi:CopA family copper-resistance protein